MPVMRKSGAMGAILVVLAGLISLRAAQAGASRFALATVSDQRGKPIVDIGADDFVVQEDNATREILDVRVADYPVVIVFDNSAKDDFAAIKASVTRFVERIGPRPLALVTLGGAPKMIATFEDDRQTLLDRLGEVEEIAPASGQPLHAIALAASAIKQTGALFSAIVVATASPVEVLATGTDELLAPIVDSRAVVHIVALDRGAEPTSRLLRALSDQTHGVFTAIYTEASYLPAME